MEERYRLLNGQEPIEFRQKIKIVVALLLIAISILLVRLSYLQVIKGAEFRQKSDNNSIRYRNIKPLRGLIMDRNGVVLVDNRPSFDVLYIPSKVKGNELSVEKLKDLYKSKSLEFSSDQSIPETAKQYSPIRLEKNVSMEKVALVETNALNLPGIYW